MGLIVDIQPTFDNDGNIITEATYFDGYHFDVMTENPVEFEHEIIVNNPKHKFLGLIIMNMHRNTTEETQYIRIGELVMELEPNAEANTLEDIVFITKEDYENEQSKI